MCDPIYILCDPQFGAATFVCFATVIFGVGVIMQYQDWNRSLFFSEFLSNLKHNRIRYPLNSKNYRKFGRNLNFITKYLMKQIYWISIFNALATFNFAVLMAYLSGTFTPNIIVFAFWTIVYIVFIWNTFGLLWFGTALWYILFLYLSKKFKEVDQKIMICVKNYSQDFSYKHILIATKEHKYLETITKRLNHFFRGAIFAIYYIATPGFQITLYLSHHKDSDFWARLFWTFISLTSFIAVVLLNLMSTWISKSAHKPYSVLFSYLSRRQTPIPLNHRMKILSFIEHLSGPEIGFYCYDLFPMNNYEFYQYLYICGLNYILIMGFF